MLSKLPRNSKILETATKMPLHFPSKSISKTSIRHITRNYGFHTESRAVVRYSQTDLDYTRTLLTVHLDVEAQQSQFEQSVAYSLHLWPALTLAVQNNWGGPDSADKRDWFAGAVVDLFPSFITLAKPPKNAPATKPTEQSEEPDVEYVETMLLQVLLDEFEVNVDDESGYDVAEQIVRMRAEIAKGNFEEVNALRIRWESRKGKKIEMQQAADADQDTDWESDDDEDGSDIDMDEAPPLVQAPKEKPPPEIDEDGFEKVTRKRK